jgi:hypothetical protein
MMKTRPEVGDLLLDSNDEITLVLEVADSPPEDYPDRDDKAKYFIRKAKYFIRLEVIQGEDIGSRAWATSEVVECGYFTMKVG